MPLSLLSPLTPSNRNTPKQEFLGGPLAPKDGSEKHPWSSGYWGQLCPGWDAALKGSTSAKDPSMAWVTPPISLP